MKRYHWVRIRKIQEQYLVEVINAVNENMIAEIIVPDLEKLIDYLTSVYSEVLIDAAQEGEVQESNLQ